MQRENILQTFIQVLGLKVREDITSSISVGRTWICAEKEEGLPGSECTMWIQSCAVFGTRVTSKYLCLYLSVYLFLVPTILLSRFRPLVLFPVPLLRALPIHCPQEARIILLQDKSYLFSHPFKPYSSSSLTLKQSPHSALQLHWTSFSSQVCYGVSPLGFRQDLSLTKKPFPWPSPGWLLFPGFQPRKHFLRKESLGPRLSLLFSLSPLSFLSEFVTVHDHIYCSIVPPKYKLYAKRYKACPCCILLSVQMIVFDTC